MTVNSAFIIRHVQVREILWGDINLKECIEISKYHSLRDSDFDEYNAQHQVTREYPGHEYDNAHHQAMSEHPGLGYH